MTGLLGLPVPEIYIQVKTDKDGNTNYVVVDGQQRIRSEEECPDYADKEFKDLSSGTKQDFWDYSIVTRELETQSEDEVKNIFLGLNKKERKLRSD